MLSKIAAAFALFAGAATFAASAPPHTLSDVKISVSGADANAPYAAATNANVKVASADGQTIVDASFESMGAAGLIRMRVVAAGPAGAQGAPLDGLLSVGAVAFPASAKVSSMCDDNGCWTLIDVSASNGAGETMNVLMAGR